MPMLILSPDASAESPAAAGRLLHLHSAPTEIDPSIATPAPERVARPTTPERAVPTIPSFLDPAGLERLKRALLPDGDADPSQPRGAFVLGSGIASVLPDLRRLPMFGDASIPGGFDLSGARRDAGEARLLTQEVRNRAEELSRRFSIGGWAMDSDAAGSATAATGGEQNSSAGVLPPAAPATYPLAGSAVAVSAGADATPAFVGGPAEPGTAQASTTVGSASAAAPAPLPGRMTLGHGGEPRPSDDSAPAVTTRQVTTVTVDPKQLGAPPTPAAIAATAPDMAPPPVRRKSVKAAVAKPVPAAPKAAAAASTAASPGLGSLFGLISTPAGTKPLP